MKFTNIIIYLFLTSFLHSQQQFQELSQNFQQKKYGSTIRQSASLLEASFKNILLQSYKFLPYINKTSRSNQNYSFDMQNDHINFNTSIEYIFPYSANMILKLSLIYSFEEVSYYSTYIENGDFAGISEHMPIYKLNNSSNSSFLWNKKQSIAYYVHKFPLTKNKRPVTDNIVPGLLLKIQFPRNAKYSTTISSVVTEAVQNTKWLELQKLYIIE